MTTFLGGLLLFLGVHSIALFNRDWRDAMASRVGAGLWKILYSVASLVGFLLMLQGYGLTRAAPVVLYTPPSFLHALALFLMVPVFPLLFAVYLPGRIKARARHPMLLATKIWATAHLLVNGNLADLILFASLLAWAVALRIALKRRATPVIVVGENAARNDLAALTLGLLAYGAFVGGLHAQLIGVGVW